MTVLSLISTTDLYPTPLDSNEVKYPYTTIIEGIKVRIYTVEQARYIHQKALIGTFCPEEKQDLEKSLIKYKASSDSALKALNVVDSAQVQMNRAFDKMEDAYNKCDDDRDSKQKEIDRIKLFRWIERGVCLTLIILIAI